MFGIVPVDVADERLCVDAYSRRTARACSLARLTGWNGFRDNPFVAIDGEGSCERDAGERDRTRTPGKVWFFLSFSLFFADRLHSFVCRFLGLRNESL